ncbi:MAG: urea transporter [Candidatus Eremiobacteraeota bacterium]|nr:urea transporter [Candidatus Eremiobacteraeota bacterium]MCW5868671.1 urea transporter [Candidatus Eremiobacteraeota bacterium]
MKTLLSAYGSFLMLPGWLPSLLLLAATMVEPLPGCAAWICALSARLARRCLPLEPVPPALELVNALLVGHLLGATYQPGLVLLGLIVAGGPACVLLTTWLRSRLQRPLCAPFVLVGLGLMSVGRSLLLVLQPLPPQHGYPFLCSLGGIFLAPNPVSGLLVALAIALGSPYLLLLCALSFGLSYALLACLGVPLDSYAQVLAGTQAMLSCLMLSGLWLSPGRASLTLGLLAAGASSLTYLACTSLLAPLGLPPLAIPFVLVTWLFLWACWPRAGGFWRFQRLLAPALPERSWERCAQAQARGLDPSSLALRLPFRGEWTCYQGFDGPHTHQEQWRYALDFVQQREGLSFAGQGAQLSDYYCWGAEILAPLAGRVLDCLADCPDNPPGEVNIQQRWGNYVMIQASSGPVVVLAHLQSGSLQVHPGQTVALGQLLGRCGNSGRSPQPHLHVHVQSDARPGASTLPFHLSHLFQDDCFLLDCRPCEGERVRAASHPAGVHLHLPVGRRLVYRCAGDLRTFTVELDLNGQFWLASDRGARVAFWETPELVAFYERSGQPDPWLDALVLALGITPLHGTACRWSDRPPARLLSRGLPWRANLHSHYVRSRRDSSWEQHGQHGRARTWACLDDRLGLVEFGLERPGQRLQARLEGIGLQPDQGIPGWRMDLKEVAC